MANKWISVDEYLPEVGGDWTVCRTTRGRHTLDDRGMVATGQILKRFFRRRGHDRRLEPNPHDERHMNHNFDFLFGRLPPVLIRRDDGTIRADPSHPMVQELVEAIRVCREAGDSEDLILAITALFPAIDSAYADGQKPLEAKDGPQAR